MKKKIIIILISIILLIGVYTTLVLIKVLPNPFLDTKDLVCKKINDQISFTYEEIAIIKFNKFAKVKEVEQKEIYVFLDEQEAKDYYEQESGNPSFNYEIDKNKVTISNTLTSADGIDYSVVTKKDIKKRYIEEYAYECE